MGVSTDFRPFGDNEALHFMKDFWVDVLKIALGTGLGGIGALFAFILIVEFIQSYAPWIFRLYD